YGGGEGLKLVMVHAGGFGKNGGLGKHTLARCKTALEVPGKKRFLILADGPEPGTGLPICTVMRNWLINNGVQPEDIITPSSPRADNSIGEVVEAMTYLVGRIPHEELLVSSSWWHIVPRLWVIWRKYGKGATKPKFVLAPDMPTPRQCFREILGTLAILLGRTGPRFTR
ncbi:MAG: ElyC/SanA/YdcF family protein, partial [Candidatus Yanofskybacteria bacterium]|nr:ElyC/SanA/YdcF family protein [Candidatus Yanofskybacteria bacterium]